MEANAYDLNAIFSKDCRYVVPLFQRPYVWDQETQWEPLWQDLVAVTERKGSGKEELPHFLGAVVLEQVKTPTGATETRQVIDGQQRFTTLQILVTALRDFVRGQGVDQAARALEKLCLNDDPLARDPDHKFKVWPTNQDREAFRRVMTAGSPEALCEAYERQDRVHHLGHRIPDAYLYFYAAAERWLASKSGASVEERLTDLALAVRGGLKVVVIDLGEKDDAQVIFETLNARGTPLLPADLVKNFLFRAAEDAGEPVDGLYREYWRPFDEEAGFWRTEVRHGRISRPRIDSFLQYYLTLETRDEVPASQLFETFRRLVADRSDRKPSDHLRSLCRYGAIFRGLTETPNDRPEATFLYRLETLDTTTIYPLLLRVFAELGGEAHARERRAILRDLESYLVRRVICGYTTKNYNRIFLDVMGWCESHGYTAESLRGYLGGLAGDSVRWPTDDELRSAWMTHELYRGLLRRRLRMILEALNEALASEFSEDVEIKGKLTVEHILPQSWQTHWPLPADLSPAQRVEAIEARNKALHRIGNLTLLNKKLNPKLSNSAWTVKRPTILEHSSLALNRHFQDVQEWSESRIDERSAALFERVQRIWSRPPTVVVPERDEVAESVDEVGRLLSRSRDNLRTLVSDLADDQPQDFVAVFARNYPEDLEALDMVYDRTPDYSGRTFLLQELASILRSDSSMRFDPARGGYVRRAE